MPAIGTRHKCRYRGRNLYVSIFPDKNEIFISMCENTKDGMQSDDITMAGVDTISRLASKCWQSYGTDELIKQLGRASRSKSDLPYILLTILESEKDA